jgi:hypothetical protein
MFFSGWPLSKPERCSFFAAVVIVLSGCSTINVTVPMHNTDVFIDDVSVGAVPPNVATPVSVEEGLFPVTYRVVDGDNVVAAGELARTEPVISSMVCAGAEGLFAVPFGIVAGLALANIYPTTFVSTGVIALVAGLFGASPFAAFQTLSALTLPLMTVFGGGFAALAVLAVASAWVPPDEVILDNERPPPPTPPEGNHAHTF